MTWRKSKVFWYRCQVGRPPPFTDTSDRDVGMERAVIAPESQRFKSGVDLTVKSEKTSVGVLAPDPEDAWPPQGRKRAETGDREGDRPQSPRTVPHQLEDRRDGGFVRAAQEPDRRVEFLRRFPAYAAEERFEAGAEFEDGRPDIRGEFEGYEGPVSGHGQAIPTRRRRTVSIAA